MPDLHKDPYAELKAFIEDTGYREHECREYLQYAKEALMSNTVSEFVYIETERRATAGDSDYIISGKTIDETGNESVKAYIWELKAPQCYIFEKDTENRLKPTKELIQAENQLLNYYHENKGSESFRNDFGVTHSDNVCFGGIIIGSRDRRVKGDFEEGKKEKLTETAFMIRKNYIYDRLNIRLMQWNYILDLLKPSTAPERLTVPEEEIADREMDPNNLNLSSSP